MGPRGDAGTPVSGRAAIGALVVANGRFWGSVAPVARGELARWVAAATGIPDQRLREMAVAKLAHEAFNAEVAATLATTAPRSRRAAVVKAIVALEVLFDYLDGRTEALFAAPPGGVDRDGSSCAAGGSDETAHGRARSSQAGAPERSDADVVLEEGRRLSESLRAVIDGQPPRVDGADSDYVNALWCYAHEHLASLPGHREIISSALPAASRCAEAQLRLHAAAVLGDEQLKRWAQEACTGSGLGWREWVGGSASSVLAMHALIASAARADAVEIEAHALDATYLAIGAVITTLDSLVDDAHDRRAGQAGYIRLYDGRGEIEARVVALIGEALMRAGQLRDGAHHTMTLAGVTAYYTTHPGAGEPENRAVRAAVRRELAPAIWPALAVLMTWRLAKRVTGVLTGTTRRWGASAKSATGDQRAAGG